MPRSFFCILLAAVASLLSLSRPARADSAVYVVEVAPEAAGLDAEALRKAIGAELHAETVAPGDAREKSAVGTISVKVDHGDVVVEYEARAASRVRRVARPSGDEQARKVVVSLAGNLARDEASELAAELRESVPRAAKPTASAATADADIDDQVEAEELRQTIRHHASVAHRDRLVFAWTATGIGVVLSGMALVLTNDRYFLISTATGPAIMGVGIASFWQKSAYEGLAEVAAKAEDRRAIEAEWAKAAKAERAGRRGAGIAGLVVGGLAIGAGTFVALYEGLEIGGRARVETAATFYVTGAAGVAAGIALLATTGVVEDGLRAYEQTRGQAASASRPNVAFGVGPSPGGAVGSFAIAF